MKVAIFLSAILAVLLGHVQALAYSHSASPIKNRVSNLIYGTNSLVLYGHNSDSNEISQDASRTMLKKIAALTVSLAAITGPFPAFANQVDVMGTSMYVSDSETKSEFETKPLYTKRTDDLVPYADSTRGFKIQRPFGWNEFDGDGQRYLKKFTSLVDYDENVVIGATAASADKTSITAYGSLESLGEKLAKKRGGTVVKAEGRVTDGITFYTYLFENPIDQSIPRPKKYKASKQMELYQLCVGKGRLWSVQVTSTDKLFPKHEADFRNVLESFFPRL